MSNETINERFKKVRKALNYNQTEFGNEIGLSRSGIAAIESSERNVTAKHIKLLKSLFNVNEEWLRSGIGEMFITDRETKRAELIGKYLAQNDPFKQKIIDFFLDATDEEWELLKMYVDQLQKNKED